MGSVDDIFMKATRYEKIHEDIRGDYIVQVLVIQEFSSYDESTRTRYFSQFLEGRIYRKVKRDFWFGYRKECLVYRKVPRTKYAKNAMVLFLNNRLEKIIEAS